MATGPLLGTISGQSQRPNTQEERFETPSLLAFDSQSVKKTTVIHIETGVDGGKNINGKSKHIVVYTFGLPWAIAVTSAPTSDN